MQRIAFHLDPVSPYAYLAFEALPRALEGLSYWVDYRPVLFAGLLQQHGQKGPAEIAPKRVWTYRQVAWRAHELGVALDLPARHPFNPLALLRLMLACAPAGQMPGRGVVEAVLQHVWRGGADAEDPARLAALAQSLAPRRDPAGAELKAELRALTEAAAADGVFGVPTFEAGGRRFWGLDALPMLAASLRGDVWFDGPAWDAAAAPRAGVQRR